MIKNQNYIDMYVIRYSPKTSAQNNKEEVTHIALMYGRQGVHFQFHTFCVWFVYRWHLTMQGIRT